MTGSYASFAAEIGNVIWAWNHLHGALCELFAQTTGMPEPDDARAIWHSIKSDSAQRGILEALADSMVAHFPNPPLDNAMIQKMHGLEEVQWLLTEVGVISSYRNDATHTLWSKKWETVVDWDNYRPPAATPDTTRGNPRGKRLEGTDPQILFRTLANYCVDLGQYCNWISTWLLGWDDAPTFRERPVRPQILQPKPLKKNHARTGPK